METITLLTAEASRVVCDLAPWLLLGTAIAAAMQAILPPGFVTRVLGGRAGVARAVAIGVPLPLCSCGVIPVGIGLKRQGAGDGPAIAFLISTPQTGIDSILVTGRLLGWPLTAFKVLLALVTGLVGGWIAQALGRPSGEAAADPPRGSDCCAEESPWGSRLRRGLDHADELIGSIWRWLVVGVLVSAAMSAFLPRGALEGLSAYGPLAEMGAALVVSLPLYVCATASAPIAAALVHAGLSPGAALVFLMAGPATNVATIGAVYRGLGARALAVYLGTIIAGSVAGGVLFDTLTARGVVAPLVPAAGAEHSHGAPWWAVASAVVLTAWVARLAARDLAAWRAGRGPEPHTAPVQTIVVRGMRCQACASRLRSALRAERGVEWADVRLEPGEATVRGMAPAERLRAVVAEAGFTPGD